MAKLTKKEKAKIELQMAAPVDRGNTWVGYRPAVFKTKKHDKKHSRREGQAICRAYCC